MLLLFLFHYFLIILLFHSFLHLLRKFNTIFSHWTVSSVTLCQNISISRLNESSFDNIFIFYDFVTGYIKTFLTHLFFNSILLIILIDFWLLDLWLRIFFVIFSSFILFVYANETWKLVFFSGCCILLLLALQIHAFF